MMAADNKLELVIQVDAAGANASIKSVNTSLSSLEKTALSSAKGASKGIDGMTLSMTKAVVAGNAIYDVAKRAFAALKDFTLGAIQTQDEMGKTAQKLGLTVKEFSELRHIAELSGIEVGQLSTSVGILSRNMLEAAQGSKEQKQAFALLGVEIKNQDGTLRSANAVLEDIAAGTPTGVKGFPANLNTASQTSASGAGTWPLFMRLSAAQMRNYL